MCFHKFFWQRFGLNAFDTGGPLIEGWQVNPAILPTPPTPLLPLAMPPSSVRRALKRQRVVKKKQSRKLENHDELIMIAALMIE